MLGTLMRTAPGSRFVEFMRSERGKKLDKFLVEKTGFSLLMRVFSARIGFPPMPVLLLYTIGRKSGEERSTVMPYVEMDGRLYLIGSNGAKPKDPLWVANLLANPDARIVVGRSERRVRARLLEFESPERARLWAVAETKTPQYSTYRDNTSRRIPVLALE